MFIFVRALNFTDEDGSGHRSSDGCLALYFEMEYRAASHECFNDPVLVSQSIVELSTVGGSDQVDLGNGGVWHTEKVQHSINDPHDTFFAYQDFYVPAPGGDPSADVDVTVSVQQNFHERNTVDFLVEMLAYDKDLNQIRAADYPTQRQGFGYGYHQGGRIGPEEAEGRALDAAGLNGPQCLHHCIVGGEKSFNEMRRTVLVQPRTYFRVWLLQTVLPSRDLQSQWCANYQLFVTSKRVPQIPSALALSSGDQRCLVEELPASLNTPRYLLGPKGE